MNELLFLIYCRSSGMRRRNRWYIPIAFYFFDRVKVCFLFVLNLSVNEFDFHISYQLCADMSEKFLSNVYSFNKVKKKILSIREFPAIFHLNAINLHGPCSGHTS